MKNSNKVIKKSFIHDSFFKEVFSHLKYALDLFRFIFIKSEFELFDWNTLKSSATSFIDKKGREKRTDLQFSVQMKNAEERVTLLFLVEHKSYQDSKALLQMLGYQTGIYEHIADDTNGFKSAHQGLPPVLPILVYQGKDKKWRAPLEFQDYLKWTSELKEQFGQNVISFRPRMLNIQALDLKTKAKGLTSHLALYILQNIWRLDRAKVEEFFVLSQDMSLEDRKFLVSKVVAYIQEYDPNFSWDVLQEIEEETIPEKEGRVMSLFQYTVDKACKKSHNEGWQKGQLDGIEKGIEKGRQELIASMLKQNTDTSFICKVTGLSEDEVNKLKNSS